MDCLATIKDLTVSNSHHVINTSTWTPPRENSTKKYVVVRNVRDTEEIKQKHGVEIRASDGMFKHLTVMRESRPIGLILVWMRTSAGIQMMI